MWSSKHLMYVFQGLSLSCISELSLGSFEVFLPSCLMTTPCQWFKLVTGFVLVTLVAQTGVCSLWKNNRFLSCHTYINWVWTVCVLTVLYISSNAASHCPVISNIRIQFVKMQLFYSVQTQRENPWKCHSKLDKYFTCNKTGQAKYFTKDC